jgi:hypothetical protein
MIVALLEAHRGFQQDQDREEANGAFLDSSTGERKGCSLPWKEHRTYKTSLAKDSRFLGQAPYAHCVS